MVAIVELRQGKYVEVISTERFVRVQTLSGRGIVSADPEGTCHVVPADVDSERLGALVKGSLEQSRIVAREDNVVYMGRSEAYYRSSLDSLIEDWGHKDRAAFFGVMKRCQVRLKDQEMTFTAMR
jgi:hypothetical protein